MKRYDVEALKERFVNMSDKEIMSEFLHIRELRRNMAQTLTEREYLDLCDEICEAEDYLCRYLALLMCQTSGFDVFLEFSHNTTMD